MTGCVACKAGSGIESAELRTNCDWPICEVIILYVQSLKLFSVNGKRSINLGKVYFALMESVSLRLYVIESTYWMYGAR